MTSTPEISQAAIDLIVTEEVSSKQTYIARYQRPEWPGGASGVTIGIGYDMGYSTKTQIAADWGALVAPAMLEVMESCAGINHGAARDLLGHVRGSILIPWDAAMDVFENRDVPKWTNICRSHLPNFDDLSPDCKGALVSLAYNRGPSFDLPDDRYREMRAIKQHMGDKNFSAIAWADPQGNLRGDFVNMVRLWPGVAGLQRRRHHEAALFVRGLAPGAATPAPTPPQPQPAPSVVPAPPSGAPSPASPPPSAVHVRPPRADPPDRQSTET